MRATDAFYLALGRFVLSWSELEMGLDVLVLIARGLTGRRDSVPHQLSGKLRFIEQRLSAFSDAHRDALTPLLTEIDGLTATRHDFVHGATFGFEPDRKGLVMTLWRLLQPRGQRREPIKVTARQVEKVADRVREITDELLDLAASASATAPSG